MKKWIKVCLIVLCVLLVLDFVAQLFLLRVNPIWVDSMELYTYDSEQDKEYHLELTGDEIWKVSMLHNLSIPVDKVVADPPPMCDRLEIHFITGAELILYLISDEQFSAKPSYYVFSCQWLYDYIQEILEQHNLPKW